jgi:hypothetical protein
VLAGHHQPLRKWVLCLFLMGLNLSNRQIALELGLSPSDAQAMTEQLRQGLVARTPAVELRGEVEMDEVYVVAGHKGQPAAVAKRGGRAPSQAGRLAGWLAGAPGRGTAAKDKPPILGLIQRGGQVVLRMLANVQHRTIRPIIEGTVTAGSLVHTDEYGVYARLKAWGFRHKTVCHGRGKSGRVCAR